MHQNHAEVFLRPPLETIEGTLEMADFKETDQESRIHPLLGYPIICTFNRSMEDGRLCGAPQDCEAGRRGDYQSALGQDREH